MPREILKDTTRLDPKGYSQKARIDYNEVFAMVARLETIRLIISITPQHWWRIHRIDIKSTFLNRVLEEEVHIEQPLGYKVKGEEDKVLKLKRAIYELKQASRA